MAINTTENKNSKNNRVSEADLEKQERLTKELLKKEKKVSIVINPINNGKAFWQGWMNGVPLAYPIGEIIGVPESIAKLISNNAVVIKEKEELEKKLAGGVKA